MLKANVTKEKIEMEVVGSLAEICADLSKILCAVNEKLTENDVKVGHAFRVMFTKGYMDGICFDDDPEHMKHYLEEGNGKVKKTCGDDDLRKALLDFLNDKLNTFKKQLEDNDEAE